MEIALNITTGAEAQSGASALDFPSWPRIFTSKIKLNSRFDVTKSAIAIGITFSILQILDGWLTSIGIYRYGLEIEANPFLKEMMLNYGHVQVLMAIKMIAIITIAFLTFMSPRVAWIKSALATLSAFYLFLAIIPWTYMLFIRPLC